MYCPFSLCSRNLTKAFLSLCLKGLTLIFVAIWLVLETAFANERYDVIAMGDAMNNIFVKCTDSLTCEQLMQEINLQQGGFRSINTFHKQYLESMIQKPELKVKVFKEIAVASASNTVRIVTKLGGKTAFIGRVGADADGQAIQEKLKKLGVKPFVHVGPFKTAAVYVFQDEAGEKAMASYIGKANAFEAADIPWGILANTKILMVEGYIWNASQNNLCIVKRAVQFAKTKGVQTALSLGNSSLVFKHRDQILEVLDLFDLIFGTREEFVELLHKGEAISDEQIIKSAQKLNKLSIITMGEQGAYIVHKKKVVRILSETVPRVVCTIGAGDAFAGAFLYGYTHGLDLEKSGKLGAHIAAKVIQKIGTALDEDD